MAKSTYLWGVVTLALIALVVTTTIAAVTGQGTAQKATKTLTLGGISGPLGFLGNAKGGDGMSCSADYGHHITGSACQGNDNDTCTNNLEVKLTSDGASETLLVSASSKMTGKQYSEVMQEHNCPQGPPSFAGTSTTTLNRPVGGTSGGSAPGAAFAVSLGGGGSAGSSQTAVLDPPITWTIDPENPDSQVKYVSAKVTCAFNGSVIEERDLDSMSRCNCALEVEVTVPPPPPEDE